MAKIVLNLQNSVLGGADALDQEWTVQVIRPDEFILPQGGQSLPNSSGILVVIPLEGVETFLVAKDFRQLFPGTALVVSGTAGVRLDYPASAEGDGPLARIGLIELTTSFSGASADIFDIIATPTQLNTRLTKEMVRLHRELTRLFMEDPVSTDTRHLEIHLLAAQLLCVLLQSDENESDSPPRRGSREDELKRLLSASLEKDLTMADLAKHFKMSPSSFAYWSKYALGCPPMRYRRSARLERGRELLLGSNLSIDQIAESLGFFDRYHFSKLFKKEFGAPPGKYKRTRASADTPATPFHLFKHNQFSEALSRCEKVLRRVKDEGERKRLLYLRFQCLTALGMSSEAADAWEALRGTATVHVAGMQLARMLFDEGRHDESLLILEQALRSDREADHELAIQVWIDQVIALVRQRFGQPLRNYLGLRKELFVNDVKSIPISCYALSQLGDLEEASHHSLDSRETLSRLYYRMGEYDQAVKTTPLALRQEMIVKVNGRRTDTIAENRDIKLLMKGKADELLEEAQPDTGSHIHALHALGRLDELRNYPNRGSFMWHYAQLYGNPSALLEADFPESPSFIHHARLLLFLEALRDRRDAEISKLVSELQDIHSPDFFWEDHNWAGVFLSAIIRGIVVDPGIAQSTWHAIRGRYRYNDQQVPWYMAGYLLGDVSKEEFLNQPDRVYSIDRWPLVTAIEHDLNGARRSSQTAYRKCLKTASPYTYLYIYRFLQWRCGQEW